MAAGVTVLLGLTWTPSVAGDFVCDAASTVSVADNGFGAEPGVRRSYATIVQAIPSGCSIEGATVVNGPIVDATRVTAGSDNMPVTPAIYLTPQSGPPTIIMATGPTMVIQGVPIYPLTGRSYVPTAPLPIVIDGDGDGITDQFVAGGIVLDGDETIDQFLAVFRSGPIVPCFTGTEGGPVSEPCTNGDPALKSLGIGLQLSASRAKLGSDKTYCPLDLRTNHPTVSVGFMMQAQLQQSTDTTCSPPSSIDAVEFIDGDGNFIAEFQDVEIDTIMGFTVSPEELDDWKNGDMWIVVTVGAFVEQDRILPAHFYFKDGFESGSTDAWSSFVP